MVKILSTIRRIEIFSHYGLPRVFNLLPLIDRTNIFYTYVCTLHSGIDDAMTIAWKYYEEGLEDEPSRPGISVGEYMDQRIDARLESLGAGPEFVALAKMGQELVHK